MREVRDWAKDKHPLIATLTLQYATFFPYLPEIFRNHKKRQLFRQKADLPNLRDWYVLYRNHRAYCTPYVNMLSETTDLAGNLVSLGTAAQQHKKLHQDKQDRQPTE